MVIAADDVIAGMAVAATEALMSEEGFGPSPSSV